MNQHGPEAPRDARGASSWLQRFYADTATYVAAWSRLWALAWLAITGVLLVALPFAPSWNLAGAAVLSAGWTALYVWLGFYYLANPEWRSDGTGRDS